jgi:hypothetical protein
LAVFARLHFDQFRDRFLRVIFLAELFFSLNFTFLALVLYPHLTPSLQNFLHLLHPEIHILEGIFLLILIFHLIIVVNICAMILVLLQHLDNLQVAVYAYEAFLVFLELGVREEQDFILFVESVDFVHFSEI